MPRGKFIYSRPVFVDLEAVARFLKRSRGEVSRLLKEDASFPMACIVDDVPKWNLESVREWRAMQEFRSQPFMTAGGA